MTAPALPPGTHVIYFGSIRDEYAESYSVQGPCDCGLCGTADDEQTRYQLRGEHIMWNHHNGAFERIGGGGLAHVAADHIVASPDGPQPWQVNQQTLHEMGVPSPDWMRLA